MASAVSASRFRDITRSAAQTRILDAALKLIAENGVGGTSLQMIADEIGVTKAAVYHQFKTKEEIVIALTERELAGLEEALEAAEAEEHPLRARELLLNRVIDLAVQRRGAMSTLQFDPVIVRLLAEHEPFQRFIQRLYGVLVGDAGDDARVSAAMLSGAIAVGVMHPLVAGIDDERLRAQLLRLTRRFMNLNRASRS
ncbi:TetR/AcrR family transcriptional regulator [Mycobacterium xenopi]|uniref:TetR family transcriptional regulator n=1 Tax=Mycobacterium xenopi TaxID=1789 RepID=A0AAD1M095_MYCXE|nr:TetR/AcrR family transcriptional regulator [Mycobacterium xenopi]EUA51253.1 bacterial regulatory s, tetR family protein [Mycobacterium xenopi 3993]MDA3640538.1 helix-turn-helix domain containing protein [Mycobacterium xenopi]MDA3657986.1 helix-turn-helix domain containing protein [Mycobacterium xenopi]MDA3662632.1 helix-turn-helix domain containing protein [Mycobacterium xenopi]ORX15238.1 TetR family transcriptional regulator [Mycobacterium xenopi]